MSKVWNRKIARKSRSPERNMPKLLFGDQNFGQAHLKLWFQDKIVLWKSFLKIMGKFCATGELSTLNDCPRQDDHKQSCIWEEWIENRRLRRRESQGARFILLQVQVQSPSRGWSPIRITEVIRQSRISTHRSGALTHWTCNSLVLRWYALITDGPKKQQPSLMVYHPTPKFRNAALCWACML